MVLRVPIAVLIVLVSALAAGCASSGAVPRPFPTPSPREKASPVPGSPESEFPNPGSEAANPASPIPNPEPDISIPKSPNPIPAIAVDGYIVAGTALQLRGTRYHLGGADPANGFDCSGLVQYVYAQYGIAVPRDVRSQFRTTRKIDDEEVRPGDLLFFATDGRNASHVAIAISLNQFVHAPTTNGVVRVETLKSDYWAPRYLGARRIIDKP
jgi:peptidoglycan DL-endopeptidase LytE